MADPKEKDETVDETPEAEATDAKAEAKDAKAEAKDAKAEAKEAKAEAKEASKPKRRGSAETSTKKSKEPAKEAPRDDSGAIHVAAHAKYVRNAPRKARLVMDHIRGKSLADARSTLLHAPRAAATDISKLLESAVANAENNFELDPDDLHIGRATVDEGPTIKRFRPRAQGRATPIHKRTSHMSIVLTTKEGK
jgi:ribosomal protein L22